MYRNLSEHLIVEILAVALCLGAESLAAETTVPVPAPSPRLNSEVAAPAIEPAIAIAPAPEHGPTWTVDDVVKLALERNPDIQSARANFEAASETVGEALSAYLPHADLNGATVRTTLPSPSAGSTPQLGIALPYTYGGISIRQTVFDFGKALNEIQSNRALSAAAEQNSLAVRNIVALAARRAFFSVLATDRLEIASEKNLTQVSEIHRRAEVMVHTGARPPFDLTQANVQLASAKLDVTNAQNARELSRVALLELIGSDKELSFALKESPSDLPESVDPSRLDVARLRELALKRRPEMKQADFAVEAAGHAVSAQLKDYLPAVSAFGFYDSYLPDYPTTLRNAWGIGIGASWNIFDGFGTYHRVSELRSREEEQLSRHEKERLNILADVSRSYANLLRAVSSYRVASEGFESATENVRLAKRRYDSNVGTILELLVAESSLVSAEAAFVQAKYSRANAYASLQTSINGNLNDPELLVK